jgi:hypothetical protein
VKTIARLARRRRFEIANSVLPDEVAKASQNGYVNKKSMVWTHLSGTWVFGGQQFPDRSPLRRGCDTGWPLACAKPPHPFQEDPWYCHQLGNWTKGQGEEEGEPGDAHRRLTLDSLCSRGAGVKTALCGRVGRGPWGRFYCCFCAKTCDDCDFGIFGRVNLGIPLAPRVPSRKNSGCDICRQRLREGE